MSAVEPPPVKARRDWIIAEWQRGRTLEEIADELGVTRQRIHQIMGRQDRLERDLVTIPGAARLAGVSVRTIVTWIRKGWITRQGRLVKTSEVMNAAGQARQPRPCKNCGGAFIDARLGRVLCPQCVGKTYVLPRRLWSATRRATHDRLVRRWQEDHPELKRQIQRRARAVWEMVHEKGMDRAIARQIAHARYPLPEREIAS